MVGLAAGFTRYRRFRTLSTAPARLKALFRLSFADSIIAAAALQLNAVLVHKDPEYEALKNEIRLKALFD